LIFDLFDILNLFDITIKAKDRVKKQNRFIIFPHHFNGTFYLFSVISIT